MKKCIISLILMGLIPLGVLANGELTGKDFVRLGRLTTLSGTLQLDDHEWLLKTDCGLYEIHFGDHSYQEGIGFSLQEGQSAVVYGYLYEDDVAVVSITATVTYQFRTELGSPLWAGRNRMNRQAITDEFQETSAFGTEEGYDGFEEFTSVPLDDACVTAEEE